jgi:hypothetical protein
MGCHMIGLVALDFIVGGHLPRRGAHMTRLVKISGVDRDNRPPHPARLGTPDHVIANFECSTGFRGQRAGQTDALDSWVGRRGRQALAGDRSRKGRAWPSSGMFAFRDNTYSSA